MSEILTSRSSKIRKMWMQPIILSSNLPTETVHSTVKPDYIKDLTRVLRETFAKGGNVVIPSFAGRTQELLYFIREIKENNLLPEYQNFEVYVDSPLAIEATNVFQKNVQSCFDEDAMALISKGINPSFPGTENHDHQ